MYLDDEVEVGGSEELRAGGTVRHVQGTFREHSVGKQLGAFPSKRGGERKVCTLTTKLKLVALRSSGRGEQSG
eukprot:335217-Prorocentrum_minimum.AAC.1